jgi:hypothetical protein
MLLKENCLIQNFPITLNMRRKVVFSWAHEKRANGKQELVSFDFQFVEAYYREIEEGLDESYK